MVYVRLWDDGESEIEVIGPHDWKTTSITDIRNYLLSYRSGAPARRWLLLISTFATLFAFIAREADVGTLGWGGALLGITFLAGVPTMVVAIPIFRYVRPSRLFIDDRTPIEPSWYRYLGVVAVGVGAAVIGTLVVTYFLGR